MDPLVKYQILRALASAHVDIRDSEEVQFVVDAALALRAEFGLPADPGVAHLYCMKGLSAALSGQIDIAHSAVGSSVRALEVSNHAPEQVLQTQLCLGSALTQLGDMRDARRRFDWSVGFAELHFGKHSREYLDALSGSAELSRIWMDFDRAMREHEFVAESMNLAYGENAKRTLEQYIRLQGARAAAGQAHVAEQNLAALIKRLRAEQRADQYHLHSAYYYHGDALKLLGRYVEAAASYEIALALLSPSSGVSPSFHQLSDELMIARMQLHLGHPQATVDTHRRSLNFPGFANGDSITRALVKVHLADALLDSGGAEAEVVDLLESALPPLETQFGADSFMVLYAQLQSVRVALASDQLEVARGLTDSAKLHALNLGYPQHAHLAMRWQLVQADIALRLSMPAVAKDAAERSLALGEEHLGANHPLIAQQRVQAAMLLDGVDPGWAAIQIRAALPSLQASHPADSRVLHQASNWSPSVNGVVP